MAGAARSTCSAVLTNRPDCYASDATRKRIIQAAEELGYFPNRFASSLRTNRTRQIGFIQPDVFALTPVIGEMFRQIEEAAIERDYRMLVSSHRYDSKRELKYIRSFLADRVDAILMYTGSSDNAEIVRQMLTEGIPVLTYDSPFAFTTPNIRVRHELGGYQQVMHLWKDAGRHNLAFAVGGMLAPAGRAKVTGYHRALAEVGSNVEEHIFIDSTNERHLSGSSLERGLKIVREIIATGREFDGLVLTSDFFASGAFKALAEAGLRVPDDVAIVGYDDIDLARVQPVELTTIRQPRELGQGAFDLLMRMIDDGLPEDPDDYEQIELDTTLIVRDSTGVARKEHN